MKKKATDQVTPDMISKVFSEMGKRGGPARADSMTPERRKEIAAKAALARWGTKKAGKKVGKKAGAKTGKKAG